MSWLLFTQESLVLPRTINSSFLVVFSYNRIYSVISFAANTFYSQFRNGHYGVPVVAQWLTNPTRNHEVAGSVPALAQWVNDPALP